ncbi:hypothetical protein [Actinoplanes sp. TBRC 11911]|uniref:hypothetical protein n=1 Tax=Actinoplanes sp. TBRC 11911 TaxID=2729386 RepID=UPI0020070906|nr:hypothetical protein [Actinoplanes sp. TBRC 11911]
MPEQPEAGDSLPRRNPPSPYGAVSPGESGGEQAWQTQPPGQYTGPGDPLPQRNPSVADPAAGQFEGFDGFAAGQPGRGTPPPVTPSPSAEANRPGGLSAFGDQRVRVPGATLTDLPDAQQQSGLPARGAEPPGGLPVRGAEPPGGLPVRGAESQSGGFPLRGGEAQGGTGFPVRGGEAFPVRGGEAFPAGGGEAFPVRGSEPGSGGFPLRGAETTPESSGFPLRGGGSGTFPTRRPPESTAAAAPPAASDLPIRSQQAPYAAEPPSGDLYGRSEPFADPFGRTPGGAVGDQQSADPSRGGLPDPFGRTPAQDASGYPAAAAESAPRADAPVYGSARPAPSFESEPYGAPAEPASGAYGTPRSAFEAEAPSGTYGLQQTESPTGTYGSPQTESPGAAYGMPPAESPGGTYGSPQSSSSPYGMPDPTGAAYGTETPSAAYGSPQTDSPGTYGSPQSESPSGTYGSPQAESPGSSYGSYQAESPNPYGSPQSESGSSYGSAPSESPGSSYGVPQSESAGSPYGSAPSESGSSSYGVPQSESAGGTYGSPQAESGFGAAPFSGGAPAPGAGQEELSPFGRSESAYPQRVPGASLGTGGAPAVESFGSAVPQPRDSAESAAPVSAVQPQSGPTVGSARPVTASASVPTASRAPIDATELPPPPVASQARVYGRRSSSTDPEGELAGDGDPPEPPAGALAAPVAPFPGTPDESPFASHQEPPFGGSPYGAAQGSTFGAESASPFGAQPQSGSPFGARPDAAFESQQASPYEAPPGSPYADQPSSSYDAPQTSPYEAQQASPYDAQQTSPYDGQQGSPYDGQQGSPYDGQQGSPYNGQPNSPFEGTQPGSPFNGQPGSPYDGQQGSPYEGQQGSPFDGQPGSPFEAVQPGGPYDGQQGLPLDGQQGSPFGAQPGSPFEAQSGSPFGARPEQPFGARPDDNSGSPYGPGSPASPFGARPDDSGNSPFGQRPDGPHDGNASPFGPRPDGPGLPFGDGSPAYGQMPHDQGASASARVAPPGPGGPPHAEFVDRGPEQFSELTTDIAGRGGDSGYVPAPALPPMPAGMEGAFGASRGTVTPPGPDDTTNWPGPEQGRFDQFKAEGEDAPAAKPETKHIRMFPILLAVVAAAGLLLAIVFGIVALAAGGDDNSGASQAFKQGDCVKQEGSKAVAAKCTDVTAFQIVSIVTDKSKCDDPKQPVVVSKTDENKSQVLCLKPNK